MIRLYLYVEGQTEQQYAETVLRDPWRSTAFLSPAQSWQRHVVEVSALQRMANQVGETWADPIMARRISFSSSGTLLPETTQLEFEKKVILNQCLLSLFDKQNFERIFSFLLHLFFANFPNYSANRLQCGHGR